MGLFGLFSKKEATEEIKNYLDKGAVVLDVRTNVEYAEGHVEGSEHIMLDTIPLNVEKIKSFNKPVIAVCRSGARSASATNFLKQQGVDIINGGPWQNVAQHVK